MQLIISKKLKIKILGDVCKSMRIGIWGLCTSASFFIYFIKSFSTWDYQNWSYGIKSIFLLVSCRDSNRNWRMRIVIIVLLRSRFWQKNLCSKNQPTNIAIWPGTLISHFGMKLARRPQTMFFCQWLLWNHCRVNWNGIWRRCQQSWISRLLAAGLRYLGLGTKGGNQQSWISGYWQLGLRYLGLGN